MVIVGSSRYCIRIQGRVQFQGNDKHRDIEKGQVRSATTNLEQQQQEQLPILGQQHVEVPFAHAH